MSSTSDQPSRETRPHSQCRLSPCTETFATSVQLSDSAPSTSSERMVPSRFPEADAPGAHLVSFESLDAGTTLSVAAAKGLPTS